MYKSIQKGCLGKDQTFVSIMSTRMSVTFKFELWKNAVLSDADFFRFLSYN